MANCFMRCPFCDKDYTESMDFHWCEQANVALDELALIAPHWTRNRDGGRTPRIIREVMLKTCEQIAGLTSAATSQGKGEGQ